MFWDWHRLSMTELEFASCESSFFIGFDLRLCLWPVYSSFSKNMLKQFSKKPLHLISHHPGLPKILLSQFSKVLYILILSHPRDLPPLLLGYKSPLFLVSRVEPALSPLPRNSIVVAPLNKVFLAVFNKCHKYFLTGTTWKFKYIRQ